MARTTDRKRGVAASSGAALAAVMLAAPGLAAPAPAPVQPAGQISSPENSGRSATDDKHAGKATASIYMKYKAEFKHKGEYAVAGVGAGRTVFEDERGNLFYVDEATGDQKFVSGKVFSKVELDRVAKADHWIKVSGKVSILGVDQNGKVIIRDIKKGTKFYLDAATGDMIFVK